MSVAPALLFASTGAMLAMPLAPALWELRRRSDAGALPIQQHDGEIRNSARSFRDYIAPLIVELERCRDLGTCKTVAFAGASAALVAGMCDDRGSLLIHELGRVGAVILAGEVLRVQAGAVFTGDLYASQALETEEGCTLRAVFGERDVVLGRGTRVMRWTHSEQAILAAGGCVLFGRASAEKAIYLGPDCRFDRMHAPQIRTVAEEESGIESVLAFRRELTPTAASGARQRFPGMLQLPSGSQVNGDLIATGRMQIGNDCHIIGSLKSHQLMSVGRFSTIHGSIVSSADMTIGASCLVRGPVIAEGTVTLEAGAQIGSPAHPTTLTAKHVRMAPGVCLHGTVWAREGGAVEK